MDETDKNIIVSILIFCFIVYTLYLILPKKETFVDNSQDSSLSSKKVLSDLGTGAILVNSNPVSDLIPNVSPTKNVINNSPYPDYEYNTNNSTKSPQSHSSDNDSNTPDNTDNDNKIIEEDNFNKVFNELDRINYTINNNNSNLQQCDNKKNEMLSKYQELLQENSHLKMTMDKLIQKIPSKTEPPYNPSNNINNPQTEPPKILTPQTQEPSTLEPNSVKPISTKYPNYIPIENKDYLLKKIKFLENENTILRKDINSDITSEESESIEIKKDIEKEVFNISQKEFTYDDAPLVCKAYGAKLANLDQIIQAHKKGANWCNLGWSENQMTLYPIQKSFYKELQEGPLENRKECGKPGINGGYEKDKNKKVGVNCYGYKPKPDKSKILYVDKKTLEDYPEIYNQFTFGHNCKLKQKYQHIKDMVESNKINITPFNNNKWSKDSTRHSMYISNSVKNISKTNNMDNEDNLEKEPSIICPSPTSTPEPIPLSEEYQVYSKPNSYFKTNRINNCNLNGSLNNIDTTKHIFEYKKPQEKISNYYCRKSNSFKTKIYQDSDTNSNMSSCSNHSNNNNFFNSC